MHKQRNSGFILIELVTTLILIGIIGAFAGLFLYNGINGYLASKRNSEAALKAQVVLDRLSAELRHIADPLPASPSKDSSITYTTSDPGLPGTRKIRYDAGTIYFSIDGGEENPLLEDVQSFSLDWNQPESPVADMDNLDGDDEIAAIYIAFTIADVGTEFKLRIHPRVFIDKPTG